MYSSFLYRVLRSKLLSSNTSSRDVFKLNIKLSSTVLNRGNARMVLQQKLRLTSLVCRSSSNRIATIWTLQRADKISHLAFRVALTSIANTEHNPDRASAHYTMRNALSLCT